MGTSTQCRITVIGSINTDMVVKTPRLPEPGQTVIGGEFFMTAGGKGANQAVAAARLGRNMDAKVAMVGKVGADVFGDSAIARLESEGIDTGFVSRDGERPSGVALISVDDSGENHIVVAPGANDTVGGDLVERAFANVPDASLVLLQLEIPLAAVEKAVMLALKKGCRVILDPAPARELPVSLVGGAYLLTPNETEAEILTGIEVGDEYSAREAAEKLLAGGVANVAITLGAQGVLLANDEDEQLIPAPEVNAVDTTAAGDCFNGALAVALAGGRSLEDSVKFACKAASIAVTRLGAQDAMPYAHELED